MRNGHCSQYGIGGGDVRQARKLLPGLILALLLPGASGQAQTTDFLDVPSNHRYYNYVQYMHERGITKGVGDGTIFQPDVPLSRANISAFVIRSVFWALSGNVDGVDASGNHTYETAAETYFPGDTKASGAGGNIEISQYRAIQKMKELRVTRGRGRDIAGRDIYAPIDGVTRAEAAVFSVRAMQLRTLGYVTLANNYGDTTKQCFSDVPPHDPFFHEIWLINQLGAFVNSSGVQATQPCLPAGSPSLPVFGAGSPVTRAEYSVLVVKVILGVANPIPNQGGQGGGGGSSVSSSLTVKENIRMLGRVMAVETTPIAVVGAGESSGNAGGEAGFYIQPSTKLYLQGTAGATIFNSAQPPGTAPNVRWQLIPNGDVGGNQGALDGNFTPRQTATYTRPGSVPLSGGQCVIGIDAQQNTLYGTGRQCVFSTAVQAAPLNGKSSYAFITLTPGETAPNGLSVQPAADLVSKAAVTGTVQVGAPAGLGWTARSTASWMRLTNTAAGVGNGTLNYTVDPNVSGPRFANILVNESARFDIGQAGTWGSLIPSVIAVTPTSGTAADASFDVTVDDPDGNQTIDLTRLVIGGTDPTAAPACAVTYRKQQGVFYLGDNVGNETALGTGNIQNANCILKVQGTSATSLSTTRLRVTVALTFKSGAFTGQRTVSAFVQDLTAQNSGWQTTGAWTVPAPPAITVTATASATKVRANQMITVGATVTGTSQTGVTWSAIPASGTFTPISGNNAYYSVPYTFGPSSSIVLKATSTADTSKSGSVTLTFRNGAPQAVSVSPQTNSGLGPITFNFQFSDSDGAGDLQTVEMYFWSDGANGGAGCHVGYALSGTLTLYDYGGGTTTIGPGSPNLDGQHCIVYAGQSSASANGNTQSVSLRVQFKDHTLPYYLPSSLIIRGKATDLWGVTSGLQNLGTWQVW